MRIFSMAVSRVKGGTGGRTSALVVIIFSFFIDLKIVETGFSHIPFVSRKSAYCRSSAE
jgi:hypothetical protein